MHADHHGIDPTSEVHGPSVGTVSIALNERDQPSHVDGTTLYLRTPDEARTLLRLAAQALVALSDQAPVLSKSAEDRAERVVAAAEAAL